MIRLINPRFGGRFIENHNLKASMRLYLELDYENAAFEKLPGIECARILRKLADKLDERDIMPDEGGKLMDINGNAVGKWSVE